MPHWNFRAVRRYSWKAPRHLEAALSCSRFQRLLLCTAPQSVCLTQGNLRRNHSTEQSEGDIEVVTLTICCCQPLQPHCKGGSVAG